MFRYRRIRSPARSEHQGGSGSASRGPGRPLVLATCVLVLVACGDGATGTGGPRVVITGDISFENGWVDGDVYAISLIKNECVSQGLLFGCAESTSKPIARTVLTDAGPYTLSFSTDHCDLGEGLHEASIYVDVFGPFGPMWSILSQVPMCVTNEQRIDMTLRRYARPPPGPPNSPEPPAPSHPAEPLDDPEPSSSYPQWLLVVDPRHDHLGSIDVVGMLLNFDPATGDFEIVLAADSAAAFAGAYRVAINLFNADAGSTSRGEAFFTDLSDHSSQSRHELRLSGNSPVLAGWSEGHRIYTNSLEGTENPDGVSLFRSTVTDLPRTGFLSNEDVIAYDWLTRPAIVRGRVVEGDR